MIYACFLYSCLFVALAPQCSAQCESAFGQPPPLSAVERYLYAQLEDALVNDGATLEQMREVFFQEPPRPGNEINFYVNITADSIPEGVCLPQGETCEPAFCNTSTAQWELCFLRTVKWRVPPNLDAVDLIKELSYIVVPWCTHGLSLAIASAAPSYVDTGYGRYYRSDDVCNISEPVKLSLTNLDCQPCAFQITGAVGQLFSWIEVYTEAGGKPQSWDPQQQAVVFGSEWWDGPWGAYWLDYDWNDTLKPLQIYGLVGCFFLTPTLFLLIPRLFLGYHNTLVTKETNPVFRSLYWGTVVVSLFLVVIILLCKLVYLCLFNFFSISFYCSESTVQCPTIIGNLAVEIFTPIIFFIISVIASRSSAAVPMPAAKFTTHVLFCCCCCFCCSSRCKSKGVQVLTLWAFMTFIYYHITEAVALVFTLFISIPLTISYTLMYVSVVFFAIMLLSIVLFSCQSTGRPQTTTAKCLGLVDICITVFGFSFVMLVFVAVIAISPVFNHLNVKGFEAVTLKFSLLPSLALSVAGWLIRKKLLREFQSSDVPHARQDVGATGHSLNNGGRGRRNIRNPDIHEHLL